MRTNHPIIPAALGVRAVRKPDPGPLNEVIRAAARSREVVFPIPEPGRALPLGEMLRARHPRDK